MDDDEYEGITYKVPLSQMTCVLLHAKVDTLRTFEDYTKHGIYKLLKEEHVIDVSEETTPWIEIETRRYYYVVNPSEYHKFE